MANKQRPVQSGQKPYGGNIRPMKKPGGGGSHSMGRGAGGGGSRPSGQRPGNGGSRPPGQRPGSGGGSPSGQRPGSGGGSPSGQRPGSGGGRPAGSVPGNGGARPSKARPGSGGKRPGEHSQAAIRNPSGGQRPVPSGQPARPIPIDRYSSAQHQEPASPQPQPGRKMRARRFYDYSLLFAIIFLTVFGLVMIYSSSSYSAQLKYGDAGYFMKRQGYIAIGGALIMVLISKINYHFFAKFALLSYLLSYVLMLMVMLTPLGIEVNGKKRWLKLGPLQFQPTELVKIALILLLAVVITEMGAQINKLKALGWIAVITIPIAALVAKNNLSSGIIILGIAFVMSFVACKLQWPFVACVGAAGLVVTFAGPIATALERIGLMHSYQLSRIHVWLDPEAYPQDGGYQVLQGLYAIGSGGLVGKGLGESIQKLGFVPEAQNDMVFSIICEELGIFGAISVILIFLFIIYRFMLIASNAPDLFGAMLVVGVMGHIAIQVVLNIAVVTNTIPNTGITLPFISYGGTSVVFLMMEMGMVLSVSNQIKLQK